eukprot:TRINITY_DN2317_c0_g2_i2.p1 TRINITY_DN2317_c0_g2~~TRINITY_DN2317_c0_g2_i2.p1  ORF type:complete len:421 (+),score=88.82 TRINITY_DN2317_c0_g2_i2:50-1312(+)
MDSIMEDDDDIRRQQEPYVEAATSCFDNPEIIRAFVFHLWKTCVPQLSDVMIGLAKDGPWSSKLAEEAVRSSLKPFFELSLWLLCCGRGDQSTPPSAYLRALKSRMPSSVCGFRWQENDMIVSCKDCGADPTCAICMPCFLESDHAGHDYKMHRSSGGVCDCGDAQAWKPTGFCCKHSGLPDDFDPSSYIPPPVLNTARITLRAVLDILIANFMDLRAGKNKDVGQVCIFGITSWLTELQGYGDAWKRVLVEALAEPAGDVSQLSPDTEPPNRSAINIMVDAHDRLRERYRVALHDFYYDMLTDAAFKRVFLIQFMRCYKELAHRTAEYERRTPDGKLLRGGLTPLSVQLLTVPKLVLELMRTHSLLDTIVNELIGTMGIARRVETPQHGAYLVNPQDQVFLDPMIWKIYRLVGKRSVSV